METIEINGQAYQLLITYKSVKNINMRIENKLIKISCSKMVSKKQILKFIDCKRDWIVKHSHNIVQRFTLNKVYFLNQVYAVKHVLSNDDRIKFQNNDVYFYTSKVDLKEYQDVFYQQANIELNNICNQYVDSFYNNILKYCYKPIPTIKFKLYKSRWGVYNSKSNTITLNLKLIHYSEFAIKAVLWHEFCHMVYLDHGKQFHQLVRLYMPKYQEYERELRL